MTYTFTLSDHSSILSANFFPAIELDKNSQYGLGLLGFYSYNSIFNVDDSNNQIGFKAPADSEIAYIEIPHGAYEIVEIHKVILNGIREHNTTIRRYDEIGSYEPESENQIFSLEANNNTLKCELKSIYEIVFPQKSSIGTLLGFDNVLLAANTLHISKNPVNIMKVRMVKVDCNITSGAYLNSEESHIIFEFDIDVAPGYKLTKEPQNIIYLPIKPQGRQFIDNITLRILDDNNDLVNFQGEKVIVKLELKKL